MLKQTRAYSDAEIDKIAAMKFNPNSETFRKQFQEKFNSEKLLGVSFKGSDEEERFKQLGIISIDRAIELELLQFTADIKISEIVTPDKNEAKYGQMVDNEFMGIGRLKKEDVSLQMVQ